VASQPQDGAPRTSEATVEQVSEGADAESMPPWPQRHSVLVLLSFLVLLILVPVGATASSLQRKVFHASLSRRARREGAQQATRAASTTRIARRLPGCACPVLSLTTPPRCSGIHCSSRRRLAPPARSLEAPRGWQLIRRDASPDVAALQALTTASAASDGPVRTPGVSLPPGATGSITAVRGVDTRNPIADSRPGGAPNDRRSLLRRVGLGPAVAAFFAAAEGAQSPVPGSLTGAPCRSGLSG
jgi:hypothetical protein